MIRLAIRWCALFEPICWLRGHAWDQLQSISAWTMSGRYCRRCKKLESTVYGPTVHEERRDHKGRKYMQPVMTTNGYKPERQTKVSFR